MLVTTTARPVVAALDGRPLPDFSIGAHAALSGYRLLTRDRARYTSYFPQLVVDSPA